MGAGPGGSNGCGCGCKCSSTIGFGRNPKPLSLGQIAWIIGLIAGAVVLALVI